MIGLRAGLLGLVLAGVASAATDPAPPSNPFADNACVQCHRDLPGRSSEIVDLEWKQSAHHAVGVGCDGCHGGNAQVRRDQFDSDDAWKRAAHVERDPEFLFMHRSDEDFVSSARGRSVSYFCGKCHANIKEKHLGSPHGEFGDPTCLYCHGQGSHRITDPTPNIIDTRGRSDKGRCSPCHRAATMQSVATIKSLLVDTEDQIRESGQLYAELEEWGYRNLELEQLHHHAKQVRSQLRQIFHSFNMRDINNFVAEIQLSVERTAVTHEIVERLRRRQREQATVGAAAVVLLLVFAGLLVYYKKSFLDKDHDAPSVEGS